MPPPKPQSYSTITVRQPRTHAAHRAPDVFRVTGFPVRLHETTRLVYLRFVCLRGGNPLMLNGTADGEFHPVQVTALPQARALGYDGSQCPGLQHADRGALVIPVRNDLAGSFLLWTGQDWLPAG